MLNAQQYTDYKNLALSNVPTNTSCLSFCKRPPMPMAKLIDTRWFDYVYRQGFSHSNNVSVSGGNDKYHVLLFRWLHRPAGYHPQKTTSNRNERPVQRRQAVSTK